MTASVAGVASLVGPSALTILKALNACAARVDAYGNDPQNQQVQYYRAMAIMDASAFAGAVASKVFPQWATKIGADVDAWSAKMDAIGMTWANPITHQPWPTVTLQQNPSAFANRIAAIAHDAALVWNVDPSGPWQPDLVNVDPPPEWLVDTYNTVLEVCKALPVIGWIIEPLLWLVGGIASLFTSYADEVFATERPVITAEAIQAATDQLAAVSVAFESIVEQCRGAGWSQGLNRKNLVASKNLTRSVPSANNQSKQIVLVALGTGAALALVWALMG